jgi:DNA-binding HxlR family transcriptional regulator
MLVLDVGRSHTEIRRQTTLSESVITEALKTLKRHDVVENNQGKWKIIVPLFRQWVLDNQ